MSDESETMEVDEERSGGESSTAAVNASTRTHEACQPENHDKKVKNGRQTTGQVESVGSNGGSSSGPALSKPRLRMPCPYGKDCYRYVHLRLSPSELNKKSWRMMKEVL